MTAQEIIQQPTVLVVIAGLFIVSAIALFVVPVSANIKNWLKSSLSSAPNKQKSKKPAKTKPAQVLKHSNKRLALAALLVIFAAAIGGTYYFLTNYSGRSNQTAEKKIKITEIKNLDKPPIVSAGFNGEVITIDAQNNSLQVLSAIDSKIYDVVFDQKGVVSKSGGKVQFADIKKGDQIAIYTNKTKEIKQGVTVIAEAIDIFVKAN